MASLNPCSRYLVRNWPSRKSTTILASVMSVILCNRKIVEAPYLVSARNILVGLFLILFLPMVLARPCLAEVVAPANFAARGAQPPYVALSPISLHQTATMNANAGIPDPAIIPTDETPTRIGDERQLVSSPWKLRILERLPSRMYFSAVTEMTQRFESNVFSAASQPRRDYVFRILPNCTLGYNIAPRTSVYANYFVIKDVFGHTPRLNQSTFQSVGGGIQHELTLGRNNVQLNFQFRELFQAVRFRQADLLPGVTVTRAFSSNFFGFFNTQLQMRSRNLFQGPQREIDPFYTIGTVYRKGLWTFTSTATLVNSFRNNHAIPPQTNMSVICDFEASRPISRRYLPGLDMFIRAEPIWNWQGKSQIGLSGFDFRLFSGLRMSLIKQATDTQLQFLRKQLKEQEQQQSH